MQTLSLLIHEHEQGRLNLGAWDPKHTCSDEFLHEVYAAHDPKTGFALVAARDLVADCLYMHTKISGGGYITLRTPYPVTTPLGEYVERYVTPAIMAVEHQVSVVSA